MSAPLFNKKIPPTCAWCRYGRNSDYTDEILCSKRGITTAFDSCRHYKYDVLKRTPKIAKPSGDYKPEDFEL